MLYNVKIKNLSEKNKNLGMYFCVLPKPALSWHDAYGYGDYSEELNGLLYHHDGFRLPNDYTKMFVGATRKCDAWDVGYEYFRGEYSGYHDPIGLKKDKLSCKGTTFESEYVAAMQFDFELNANKSLNDAEIIARIVEVS